MPTSKTRLQVILSDEPAAKVKALAEERGLSVSAMCSQLIHAALELKEFQPKPDLSKYNNEMVKAAIGGHDIADFKIAALLELITEIKNKTE